MPRSRSKRTQSSSHSRLTSDTFQVRAEEAKAPAEPKPKAARRRMPKDPPVPQKEEPRRRVTPSIAKLHNTSGRTIQVPLPTGRCVRIRPGQTVECTAFESTSDTVQSFVRARALSVTKL